MPCFVYMSSLACQKSNKWTKQSKKLGAGTVCQRLTGTPQLSLNSWMRCERQSTEKCDFSHSCSYKMQWTEAANRHMRHSHMHTLHYYIMLECWHDARTRSILTEDISERGLKSRGRCKVKIFCSVHFPLTTKHTARCGLSDQFNLSTALCIRDSIISVVTLCLTFFQLGMKKVPTVYAYKDWK